MMSLVMVSIFLVACSNSYDDGVNQVFEQEKELMKEYKEIYDDTNLDVSKENTNYYIYEDGKYILIKRKDIAGNENNSFRLYEKVNDLYSKVDVDAEEYYKHNDYIFNHEI